MAMTINGTNGVTFNDGTSMATAYGGTGFRNRIINGDMRIDQRNNGASVTPAATGYTYSIDRWSTYCTATGKFSFQQNAGGVTPPTGFQKYLGFTSLAATSVGASDLYLFKQVIEGLNSADLNFGSASASPVTISFWVRSSLTGTFGGSLNNGGNNRCYPFAYTVSLANTWEQKTITVAGDTTGAWETNTSAGVQLFFGLGVGSSSQGTANTWQASVGGVFGPTGATSVVGTSGATFYITGVQLEAGSVATPFERRDYGRELMMCQRYYEKSFSQDVVPSNGASATALSTTNGSVTGIASNVLNAGPTVNFKVTKRATPTMTKFGNNSGDWVYALQNSAAWVGGASNGFVRISDSSFTADQQAVNQTGVFVMGHWVASAEL